MIVGSAIDTTVTSNAPRKTLTISATMTIQNARPLRRASLEVDAGAAEGGFCVITEILDAEPVEVGYLGLSEILNEESALNEVTIMSSDMEAAILRKADEQLNSRRL